MQDREPLLREFYRSLSGRRAEPLEPDSELYVPILQASPGKDPILDLFRRISWAESESVNLLTGFRGNGKSTELRRLRRLLEDDGCRVILIDMVSYLLLTKPIELPDFLLGMLLAVTDAVRKDADWDPVANGLWERVVRFLKSEVQIDGLTFGAESGGLSAELALKLRTDPTFKEHVQTRLRGHYASIVQQARAFMTKLVEEIRRRSGDPDRKVVILVDSLEQLRGVGDDAELVQKSVVELFSGQGQSLALPQVHVVYTVPPYLLALAPNVARTVGGGTVAVWPNVHVRERSGADDPVGVSVMEAVIHKRSPSWEQILTREQLHGLARATGGDLRDYFRLLRECAVSLQNSGKERVDEDVLRKVQRQLRQELSQIAADDALWLERVHASKDTVLPSVSDLPRLIRFLDSNLIMNYLNGDPWYDLHPLVIDDVLSTAAAERQRRASQAGDEERDA